MIEHAGLQVEVLDRGAVRDTYPGDILQVLGVFTPEECRELVALLAARDDWEQSSMAVGGGPTRTHVGSGRTSHSLKLHYGVSVQLGDWGTRIAQAALDLGAAYAWVNPHVTNARRSDGWEALRYEPDQRFGLHVDQILGHDAWAQRQLSVVVYLNDDFEGGETVFPRQQVSVSPMAGSAIVFPPTPQFPHVGEAPQGGVKYSVAGWLYPTKERA